MIVPGLAAAQGSAPPWLPSNETVDGDLDRALDNEFNGKADQVPEPIPDYAAQEEEADDDGFRVRLRLMGAYWHTQLTDLEFSKRNGTSGGDVVKIDDPYKVDIDNGDDDFEGEASGFYSLTLDLGRHVALRGGFSHVTEIEHAFEVGAPGGVQSFTYGNTTWQNGDRLDTSYEIFTGDFDLVLRPLNNRYVTFDLSIGMRYVSWQTEFRRNQGADPVESDKLEAVVPTVGVGLAIRPVKPLELFANARIGHLSYEVDEGWEWDEWDDEWDYQEQSERETTTVSIEIGVSLTLADTVGLIVGYRYDALAMERVKGDRQTGFEGATHGLFGGLILQFGD